MHSFSLRAFFIDFDGNLFFRWLIEWMEYYKVGFINVE